MYGSSETKAVVVGRNQGYYVNPLGGLVRQQLRMFDESEMMGPAGGGWSQAWAELGVANCGVRGGRVAELGERGSWGSWGPRLFPTAVASQDRTGQRYEMHPNGMSQP